MHHLRKILFPLFVIFYLIYCPFIILRALGIIFTPQSHRSLIHTGLISLGTHPAGANVELNGKRSEEKTPTLIHDLTEGLYHIQVSLPGYRSWSQNIKVEATKAVSLEDIILIPEPWSIENLAAPSFKELISLEGNPYVLLKSGNLITDLFIYRWPEESLLHNNQTTNPVVALFSPGLPYLSAEVLSLTSIPESPFLLLHAVLEGKNRILWLDARDEKVKITDLTDLFPQKIPQTLWDPQRTEDLFLLEGQDLTRIRIDEKAIFPKICRNLRGVGVANKRIYGLNNNTLDIFDYEGKVIQSTNNSLALAKELSRTKAFYRVFPFSDNIIALLSDKDDLIVIKPTYFFAKKVAAGLKFNSKTRQLVFWDNTRIRILDFSQSDETLNTPLISLDWLVEKGRKIEQVFFVNEGSHLLFRDTDTVFLLDLNSNVDERQEELFRVKRNTAIDYSDKTGKIYFIDEKTEKFSSATLRSVSKHETKESLEVNEP